MLLKSGRGIFFIVGFLLLTSRSFAVDLMGIYQEAVLNDPVLQEAYYVRLSTEQSLPQARSDLLPFLLGTADIARTHERQSLDEIDATGFTGQRIRIDGSFTDQLYVVSLRQAVFNYSAWRRVQSAKAMVKQAEAVFNEAAQNLVLRVAEAYFAVLEAEDILRFTRSEKRASARRLEEAKERYNVGLEPITTVYEAEANYDAIVAEEIAAVNAVVNSKEAIRLLVGRTYQNLSPLKQEVPLVRPTPNNVQEWEDAATAQNYQMLANRYAVEAARENIEAQKGENYPTLEFSSSYNVLEGNNPTFVGEIQGINDKRAEVRLIASFPLIQGGLVRANTRQAIYDYEGARAVLEESHRDTVVTTRQSFNDIISGISKVKADKRAIISGENFLESIEAQYRVGTRTLLDVLEAQRNLFDQQRNHSIDQYAYLLSTLRLKLSAATLGVADLQRINTWLAGATVPLQDEPELKAAKYEQDI